MNGNNMMPRPNAGSSLSLQDIYAMNPHFVHQYMAARGMSLTPNMLNNNNANNNMGMSPMRQGGNPMQQMPSQPIMYQNQAHSLAQQMNINPALMQMNTPIGPSTTQQPILTIQQQQQKLQQQLLYNQQRFLNQQQQSKAMRSSAPQSSSVPGGPSGLSNSSGPTQQMMMMNEGASLLHQQKQIRPMPGNQSGGVNFPAQMNLVNNSNMNQGQIRYNQILRPPFQQQQQQQQHKPMQIKHQPTVNLMRPSSQLRPPLDPEAVAGAKIAAELREHVRIVKSRFVLFCFQFFFVDWMHKPRINSEFLFCFRAVESMVNDQKALLTPSFAPFKDKADVVNRLLPYHTVQFPPYPKDLKAPSSEKKQETIRKAQDVIDKVNDIVNERSKMVVSLFVAL